MPDRIMVDANVLIFGCRNIKPSDKEPLLARSRDSRNLLLTCKSEIWVASVAWLEFLRGHRPEEEELADKVTHNVRIAPVDAPAVVRAHELLNARNLKEKKCRTCNSWERATPCSLCKKYVSNKINIIDAMVAAVAENDGKVNILYSYDNGALEYAPYVKRKTCRFERPPNADGPLFDRKSDT